MRESYYVGYDPQLKIWDVMPVTPNYPEDFWVFKVMARNEKEALSKGIKVFQEMITRPCDDALEVMRHAHRQALRVNTAHKGLFAVDIPMRMLAEADKLISRGFFMQGHENQVIINPLGAGWKALEYHLSTRPKVVSREAFMAHA